MKIGVVLESMGLSFRQGLPLAAKMGAAGEFEIHADTCNGPLLASVPPAAASATGPIELTADVATAAASVPVRDVCVVASGDPREGQWALARMTFAWGDAR